MRVMHAVRWSRDHAQPRRLTTLLTAVVNRIMRVGDDGLTAAERQQYAARYAATVGKTPTSTPERTERLALLAGRVEPRPRRSTASV